MAASSSLKVSPESHKNSPNLSMMDFANSRNSPSEAWKILVSVSQRSSYCGYVGVGGGKGRHGEENR